MSEHTEGEWYASVRGNSLTVRHRGRSNGTVARVAIAPSSPRYAEGQANALLLAQAPKLAAVLKAVVDAATYQINFELGAQVSERLAQAIREANEVLEKAGA